MTQVISPSQRIFALVDCNNFFASCERLFRPELQKRPVAVLSNNDGCVIARSNEVKALGVPMAAPHFKYKGLFAANKVATFSANFQLYGDISERVVQVLEEACPFIEVYSIDESFLELTNMAITDYTRWAQDLAARVEKEVGIPVSVGIGGSKTLAKAATHLVKKQKNHKGGLSIGLGNEPLDSWLGQIPLEDVWGIGRRLSTRLQRTGISNALQLTQLRDSWVLDNLTITGLRTVRELRGESCKELNTHENIVNQQKSLSVTRGFGKTIRLQGELEAATAALTARAAMRLRRKDQLAWGGRVFIRRKLPDRTHAFVYAEFKLSTPTSYTGDLIRVVIEALDTIYDSDFKYDKSGVIFNQLLDESAQQMSFFGGERQAEQMKSRLALMKDMDDLSLRYGKSPVSFAAEGFKKDAWRSKQTMLSPFYTTKWSDLPKVKVS